MWLRKSGVRLRRKVGGKGHVENEKMEALHASGG